MADSPLNWKSGFRKLKQQNEALARMMRNQAITRNQAPLFPPALEEHTVGQGQIVSDTMLRAMTDPDVALAYWLEVNSAWLRLWRSAIESIATGVPPRYEYDIFLSHAKLDADQKQLDPVIKALEDGKFKFKVFVDWRDAPELDRRNVTKETARALREKMKRSRALVYILSEKGALSHWMPWELGFFDGHTGLVFILPLNEAAETAAKEIQFVGIYDTLPLDPDNYVKTLAKRLSEA